MLKMFEAQKKENFRKGNISVKGSSINDVTVSRVEEEVNDFVTTIQSP